MKLTPYLCGMKSNQIAYICWLGGAKLAHVGGNANNGSYCGSFYVNSNNGWTDSNTNIGLRTTKLKRLTSRTSGHDPRSSECVKSKDITLGKVLWQRTSWSSSIASNGQGDSKMLAYEAA